MKWSRYNIMFTSSKCGHLLYNSRTNSLSKLDNETFNTLQKIKNEEKIIIDEKLNNELIQTKIIVENNEDLDYFNRLKYFFLKKSFFAHEMNLTIAPTLNCNFNCFYCYEGKEKVSLRMSKKVEKQIINFIKFSEAKFINVTWYGGEPLMSFQTIKRLTDKFETINKEFAYSIVTNGYLLDEQKSIFFSKIKLEDVQITVDGLKEQHDKYRPLKNGKGSFDRIMSNLETFIKYNENVQILLRCNIDKNNEKNFHKLFFYIKEKFSRNKNIYVYPGFIFTHVSYDSPCNPCMKIDNEKINFFIELHKRFGININFFPFFKHLPCTANKIDSFVIDPNGKLYKCWNDIGIKEFECGHINKKIIPNEIVYRYTVGSSIFNDPKCKSCFLLPICKGKCSYFRIQNIYFNKNYRKCSVNKKSFLKLLELHCELKNSGKTDMNIYDLI